MNHFVDEHPVIHELRGRRLPAHAQANESALSSPSSAAMDPAAAGGRHGDMQRSCWETTVVVGDDIGRASNPGDHGLRSACEFPGRYVDAHVNASHSKYLGGGRRIRGDRDRQSGERNK